MTKADLVFLEKIWRLSTEDNFSKEKLAERVLKDGGHDMSRLSKVDLIALIEGQFDGDWHSPAFSFSELLAYYAACGREMMPQQIVGWVFASFVMADAIKHDAAEWERQFNNFFEGFTIVKDKLEAEDSVEILQRIFC